MDAARLVRKLRQRAFDLIGTDERDALLFRQAADWIAAGDPVTRAAEMSRIRAALDRLSGEIAAADTPEARAGLSRRRSALITDLQRLQEACPS